MDKSTLSNYGWLVIITLILAVMLALATPFGTYVGDAVVSVANGYVGASNNAIDEDNISNLNNEWDKKLNLSGINIDLATNTWEDVQKVSKAGKVTLAGWSVGDTKDLEINGLTKTATLIGIDHDGKGTTTWMVTSTDGLGDYYPMNKSHIGGWEVSTMRKWLNTDIYTSMADTKDYIKPVTKMTNNIGYHGDSVSPTSDKVFLLSLKETGMEWQNAGFEWTNPDYIGIDVLNSEGTTYEWFANGGCIGLHFWLRSYFAPMCDYLFYSDDDFLHFNETENHTVYPAFVIG